MKLISSQLLQPNTHTQTLKRIIQRAYFWPGWHASNICNLIALFNIHKFINDRRCEQKRILLNKQNGDGSKWPKICDFLDDNIWNIWMCACVKDKRVHCAEHLMSVQMNELEGDIERERESGSAGRCGNAALHHVQIIGGNTQWII